MKRILFLIGVGLASCGAFAEIKVSDVKAFSGYPWKEVVVGYTITGKDSGADVIELKATDKAANKTYTAQSLTGVSLTEGRHVLRWNAATEGVKFSSANVVFSVSILHLGGVQLWAKGPCWAECNVGAKKPEEFGYYFWWGDTIGCSMGLFSFSTVCPTMYMSDSELLSAGYIDSSGNLVAKYDAATKYLGSWWRMPTDAEWNALINNCTTTWTTRNGVNGLLVTGKGIYATKSIFLPAAGFGFRSEHDGLGTDGSYRSSTPNSRDSQNAWYFSFSSSGVHRYDFGKRHNGDSVRPVREFVQ